MSGTWVDRSDAYRDAGCEAEPAADLRVKEPGSVMDAIWWVGAVLSLGVLVPLIPRRRYLERFATTVGPRVEVPRAWVYVSTRLLRHECRHVTQFVRFGYLVPILGWVPGLTGRRLRAWVGVLPAAVVYLLLPLPVLLPVGRLLLEADAEVAAWRAGLADRSLSGKEVLERAEGFGSTLAGPSYGYCLGARTLLRYLARRLIRVNS